MNYALNNFTSSLSPSTGYQSHTASSQCRYPNQRTSKTSNRRIARSLLLGLQCSELGRKRCACGRATLAGAVEVLQGDERGLDARDLRGGRVVRRKREGHAGVVDGVAGCDVLRERLEMRENGKRLMDDA